MANLIGVASPPRAQNLLLSDFLPRLQNREKSARFCMLVIRALGKQQLSGRDLFQAPRATIAIINTNSSRAAEQFVTPT